MHMQLVTIPITLEQQQTSIILTLTLTITPITLIISPLFIPEAVDTQINPISKLFLFLLLDYGLVQVLPIMEIPQVEIFQFFKVAVLLHFFAFYGK